MVTRTLTAVALTIMAVTARPFAQQQGLFFEVCARSETWQRPSAEVQARIWNDPRYRGIDVASVPQWTHDFFTSPPDSASLAYDSANLSGVWTDDMSNRCASRGQDAAWVEVWTLQHHVVSIAADRSTYTVVVQPGRGFDIVQFRREPTEDAARSSILFVDSSGRSLDRMIESQPAMFVHTKP